ncbi:MAG: hypothetical protein ACREQ8_18190 [Woeseiaceae bacterium]
MPNEPQPNNGGLPPKYRVYDIEVVVYDAAGQVVESWEDVQELLIDPPNIAVRRTRSYEDGDPVVYEDRGTFNTDFSFAGVDGFGGTWSGRPIPQAGVLFAEGHGERADFWMTNWVESDREEHCLRVLHAKTPVRFLSRKELSPGRYYIRTRDHVRSASDEVPEDMIERAAASS